MCDFVGGYVIVGDWVEEFYYFDEFDGVIVCDGVVKFFEDGVFRRRGVVEEVIGWCVEGDFVVVKV